MKRVPSKVWRDWPEMSKQVEASRQEELNGLQLDGISIRIVNVNRLPDTLRAVELPNRTGLNPVMGQMGSQALAIKVSDLKRKVIDIARFATRRRPAPPAQWRFDVDKINEASARSQLNKPQVL